MADMMQFPETWEEYEEQYGFTDKEEIYTNGSRLIQSFRVKQWLEHIKPKAGKWKEEYAGNGWNDFWDYTCSECGRKFHRFYKSNYCPNCGVRMTKVSYTIQERG